MDNQAFAATASAFSAESAYGAGAAPAAAWSESVRAAFVKVTTRDAPAVDTVRQAAVERRTLVAIIWSASDEGKDIGADENELTNEVQCAMSWM